jgi:sugar phosphate isomerase/epimerase
MDLSFQLYSARNFPLAEVLKTIAGLGYKYVEGYGGLYSDVPGLKSQLGANGLAMPTAHIGLDQLEKPQETLRLAEILGINTVVCPWLAPDQRPQDAAGWRTLGERLARVAEPYTSAGLTFGYHNHDFEYAALPDGRYPMDVLLEAAPGIACEADIAWIVRGKADPFPWLEKFGSRIIAVHLKDIAPAGQNTNEDGWADVGHGTMPWKDLLNTVQHKTLARYFVVEHDNPSDITRFATRSIEAVRAFGA